MGIFGALTTAVGGLRAKSYALENISGNIANSQTTAFKRDRYQFPRSHSATPVTQQLAGSVTASSRSTNTVQGRRADGLGRDLSWPSTAPASLRCKSPAPSPTATPVFDGVDRYTRRGDFQIDKSGYLVNGAGYFLQGVPIDPTTGNPTGSSPQVLKFQNDFLPAQETTKIDYRANLASYPLTTDHETSVQGSELLAPGSFSAGHNPLVLGTPPAPYTDATRTAPCRTTKRRVGCEYRRDHSSPARRQRKLDRR